MTNYVSLLAYILHDKGYNFYSRSDILVSYTIYYVCHNVQYTPLRPIRFLENESYFMKRQFKNCIPFIVPYPMNRTSHSITWEECGLKRSWPIQATKPAGVVLECDSLYNIKNYYTSVVY